MSTHLKAYIRFWGILSLFLLAFSQQEVHSQSPDFIYKRDIEITIKPAQQSSYRVSSVTRTRITYLSERSKDVMTYTIPSSFIERVSDVKYTFEGKESAESDVKTTSLEYGDKIFSDDIEYVIKLPKVPNIGAQFYYEYHTEYCGYDFLSDISIPRIDSLGSFTITLHHPDSLKPAFSVVPVNCKINYTVEHQGEKQTSILISGIAGAKDLDYFNANHTAGIVVFSILKNGKETLPITPRTLVDWYSTLASIQPRLYSADRKILADTLDLQRTDIDKLHIIYDYVRKEFRYSSDVSKLAGLVPRKLSEVIKSRFADCKERAALISAIAAEHNILVKIVLFPSEHAPESEFAYPTRFNHVINLYTRNNDTLFLDPTSKFCPFGSVPWYEVDQRGLVLDSLNPGWAVVKEKTIRPDLIIEIDANLDSLKTSKGRIILHNQNLIGYLATKKALLNSRMEKSVSSHLAQDLNKIRIENISEETVCDDSVILRSSVDLSSFIIKSAKNCYAPKTAFSMWDGNILTRRNDSLLIVLADKFNAVISIRLHSASVNMQPQQIQIGSTSSLQFTATAAAADTGTINLTYTMFQKNRIYPKDEKPVFLDFYESYIKNRTNMFLLGENHAQKITAN